MRCLLLLGFAAASRIINHATACVPLQGIGGAGALNLTIMQDTLGAEPFDLVNPIIPTMAGCSGGLETPISMRMLLVLDTAAFSLSSMFRPAPALDIFGEEPYRRCQPGEGEDRALFDLHLRVAVIYAAAYVAHLNMPDCPDVAILMESRGHALYLLDEPDLSTDTPWGLAKAYVDDISAYLADNDGFNADGGAGGQTYNRIPFSDFTKEDSEGNKWKGYTPVNTPYEFSRKKRWQPLVESDGLGYISTQEHVTPHIGATARFLGFRTPEKENEFAARDLDKPSYRNSYKQAAEDVLRESGISATNGTRQFAVNFFDNKFSSLIPLKIVYFLDREDTLEALDFYLITVKVQLAIWNSVILAWREKIRHDAPRPPSVVRAELGDKLVETYAGPEDGVQTIKAEEWQPFIRTMPHSEYPSASSCICEAFVKQIQEWTGTDTIDPPIGFPPPAFGGPIVEFSSWSAISEMCGDSRFWGGMHFEGAIPAGAELCGGDAMAKSISASIDDLIDGDATAAVFKRDVGELMVRPL